MLDCLPFSRHQALQLPPQPPSTPALSRPTQDANQDAGVWFPGGLDKFPSLSQNPEVGQNPRGAPSWAQKQTRQTSEDPAVL